MARTAGSGTETVIEHEGAKAKGPMTSHELYWVEETDKAFKVGLYGDKSRYFEGGPTDCIHWQAWVPKSICILTVNHNNQRNLVYIPQWFDLKVYPMNGNDWKERMWAFREAFGLPQSQS